MKIPNLFTKLVICLVSNPLQLLQTTVAIESITPDNFFCSTTEATKKDEKFNSRPTDLTGQNIYITNCQFISCVITGSTASSDRGGAISLTTSNLKFYLEKTTFRSCKTSASRAGAVYIESSTANSVLSFVCAVDCCSTYSSSSDSYGQFDYIVVGNSDEYYNYVIESTIASCLNENDYSCRTMYHRQGSINLRTVNLSNNECYGTSGILCDSASGTSVVSFSSFRKNIANNWICNYFYSGTYELKYSNIIENTETSTSDGIIYCYESTLTISKCCFIQNTGGYLFEANSGSTIKGSENYVEGTFTTSGNI